MLVRGSALNERLDTLGSVLRVHKYATGWKSTARVNADARAKWNPTLIADVNWVVSVSVLSLNEYQHLLNPD